MRKSIAAASICLVCSCSQSVTVPTAQELLDNRQLLTEWQAKCSTGEYSKLGASEKAELCSTTNEASMSVAQIEAGKKDSAFFESMSKRK